MALLIVVCFLIPCVLLQRRCDFLFCRHSTIPCHLWFKMTAVFRCPTVANILGFGTSSMSLLPLFLDMNFEHILRQERHHDLQPGQFLMEEDPELGQQIHPRPLAWPLKIGRVDPVVDIGGGIKHSRSSRRHSSNRQI